MDISRTETQHEIARFQHPPKVILYLLALRLVRNALLPGLLRDGIHDRLPAHSRNRLFARRINVGEEKQICLLEGAAKFILERLCARVAMRLEHCEHAFAPRAASTRERGAYFRWMVPVVVHNHEPLAAILDFKPPPRTAECLQRLGDFRERHANFRRKRDHARCVAHVMPPRHVQRHRSERFAAARHDEVRLKILRVQCVEAVKSCARLPI